jgi:hypothetical protein
MSGETTKPIKPRSIELRIYDQLSKDLKESKAKSFTIADIRAASNKVFTGNKEGDL